MLYFMSNKIYVHWTIRCFINISSIACKIITYYCNFRTNFNWQVNARFACLCNASVTLQRVLCMLQEILGAEVSWIVSMLELWCLWYPKNLKVIVNFIKLYSMKVTYYCWVYQRFLVSYVFSWFIIHMMYFRSMKIISCMMWSYR